MCYKNVGNTLRDSSTSLTPCIKEGDNGGLVALSRELFVWIYSDHPLRGHALRVRRAIV